MLKAAEVTLAAVKSHFAVLSGSVYDVVRPGEDLMIRMFTPAPGQALPSNVFPAQEVFNNINPRVKR